MRPAALALIASTLAIPATAAAAPIGTGARQCTLEARADCRGVIARWSVSNHGSLRGINLRRADLRGADLRGADLRKADFRGARLQHADFRGARLLGARFGPPPGSAGSGAAPVPPCRTSTDCRGANLSGANLQGVNLTGVDFTHANLSKALLWGADMTDSNLQGADLSYVQGTVTLVRAKAEYSYWVGATVRAYAEGIDLSHSNLTWVQMSHSDFRSAQMQNVLADNAYLGYSNFQQADLSSSTLTHAYLGYADFRGGNLGSTVTTGAIWQKTICPNGTVTDTGC